MKTTNYEELTALTTAIDNFLYYISNYESIYDKETKTYIPDIFLNAEWGCDYKHLYGKWLHKVEICNNDTAAAFVQLYYELDTQNKRTMLEWITENYGNE